MRRGLTPARGPAAAAALACGALAALLVAGGFGGTARARAQPSADAGASRLRAISDREGARDTTGLARMLLDDPVPAVRGAAAVTLGRIQNRGSVRPLAAALNDRTPSVRREAAFALGLVGDTSGAPDLVRRLTSEQDPAVREAIVHALGMAGGRVAGSALTRSLRASRVGEREAAALAAGRLRDSTLVPTLVAVARDPSPEVRWRVAYALGRIGDPAGASALRTLSADRVESVREQAARALGDVRDSTAAPRLVSLLGDSSWRVRVNAAHALGALEARRDARSLVPLLADANPHVRWEAAQSLGLIRDTGAIAPLTQALRDSSTGVIQAAAIALLKIQGESSIPNVAPAIDRLPGFLRSGLLEALGPVPGTLAREILLARARDSTDAATAAGAAVGLAARPQDAAVSIPVLRPLLQARDYAVVSSAAEALGTLGDSASVPALAALLQRTGSTEANDIRASAATALAAIKTRAALESLRPARRDPERRVREIATAALGLPPDSVAAEPAPALRVEPLPARLPTVATVETTRGAVRIALDPRRAPRTVENFARLARSGYFDGIRFHRVVPNFVVQDGCPRGDGWGGPGYAIPCEYNDRPYETGTVGMALSGKDTGGSQWFVTLSPQPRLEGRYTAFGKVESGMGVVERLMPGDRILRVVVR